MRLFQYPRPDGRPAISFEVFPPKTDEAMRALDAVLPDLIALRPDFLTVTYGAMGTTQERTLGIATRLKRDYGIETASHLTCVGASRVDLDRVLRRLVEGGIRNIVALRGDPPKGETEFKPAPDGYSHASELVRHIRAFERADGGDAFGIAVAGYPEKHVEAPDLATDIGHLRGKVEAGADAIVTQLFFDNRDFFSFVEKARAAGVRAPIIPGLLPAQSAKQVVRLTALCAAKVPPSLLADLTAAGDDAAHGEEIGVRHCVAQAKELLQRGVPGIHFYVLNRSAQMKRIQAELAPLLAGTPQR